MLRINLRSRLITSILLFAALCTSTFSNTIYVDDDAVGANNGTNWVDAYICLQDALAAAQGSDEIHVAKGTYQPDQRFVQGRTPRVVASGNREVSFQLINGVVIKGAYAGVGEPDPNVRDVNIHDSILSGDLEGNDVDLSESILLRDEPTRMENSYRVVMGDDTDQTAVLDGFTVTGGNANGTSPSNCGGGVHNLHGSPTLRNCTFVANTASDLGGGLYNANYSSPILQNCMFIGNSAGGGGGLGNREYSNSKVENCVFVRNSSGDGAGVCNQLSSPTLSNCKFEGNKAFAGGGGMNNYNYSAPIVNECMFIANSAENDGGGVYSGIGCSPEFIGCSFIRNSADSRGGGVINADDFGVHPTFLDCTFIENKAAGGGGGMCNSDSSPIVMRCEFRNNLTNDGGGAMDNRNNSQPILTDCVFNSNSANRGGAILNWFDSSSQIGNCTFKGNTVGWVGGAICDSSSVTKLSNCLFYNNLADGAGAIFFDNCIGSMIANCTFAGNAALFNGDAVICDSESPSHVKFTNCIIWDKNNEIWNNDGSIIELTCTNIRGGQAGIYDPFNAVIWGKGNINTDPLFVNPGYWVHMEDSNVVVESNDPNTVWIDGDYHLKSQAGRWDPVSESWIVDDVTSPCIDAGDPNNPVGDEPEPNGGIVNMGAYGGTAEASMSPAGAEEIVYVQWLGHSTVKVSTDDCIVYVDPERVPESLHDATLVCVTHTHGDHYSPSDIAKVSNAQTQFIGPPDVIQRYGSGQTIAPGQTIEFDFVTVTAVPAYNINKSNHPRSNNWVGFIIELGGKRIYVAGDTDLIEEMKSLGDIDVAFLPAGGTYTMNATEAAEATEYIKPDLAIPYHWGQSVGTLVDAQRFAELAHCPAKVLAVGEMISSDDWPVYSPLITHWTFDEAEGNIANDSAGEYHGTLYGEPVWQLAGGKKDGALQLDGNDDYIGTNFVLDPAKGSFSVFAWIKSDVPGQVIISQADGSGSGEKWLGTDPLLGKLMTGLVPPPAGRFVPQPLVSESVITDGQWHHIGFVWDGSYRTLYMDGTEVAKDAAAQNSLKSADGGMYIGAGKNLDAGSFFSGLIDDIRIYNQTLSAEEIEELAH